MWTQGEITQIRAITPKGKRTYHLPEVSESTRCVKAEKGADRCSRIGGTEELRGQRSGGENWEPATQGSEWIGGRGLEGETSFGFNGGSRVDETKRNGRREDIYKNALGRFCCFCRCRPGLIKVRSRSVSLSLYMSELVVIAKDIFEGFALPSSFTEREALGGK